MASVESRIGSHCMEHIDYMDIKVKKPNDLQGMKREAESNDC